MSRIPNGMQRALGCRVRNLRDFRGWSLQDLAERLEVAPDLVNAIEQGDLDPTLSTIEDLADCFELPLSGLLVGIERL